MTFWIHHPDGYSDECATFEAFIERKERWVRGGPFSGTLEEIWWVTESSVEQHVDGSMVKSQMGEEEKLDEIGNSLSITLHVQCLVKGRNFSRDLKTPQLSSFLWSVLQADVPISGHVQVLGRWKLLKTCLLSPRDSFSLSRKTTFWKELTKHCFKSAMSTLIFYGGMQEPMWCH